MDDLVYLSAPRACSDSFGHRWSEAGSVVEVTGAQAAVLLAIPDGGFTVAEKPAKVQEAPVEVTEPAPESHKGEQVTEPAPKPQRGRQARG
jgi:hypothetical protein